MLYFSNMRASCSSTASSASAAARGSARHRSSSRHLSRLYKARTSSGDISMLFFIIIVCTRPAGKFDSGVPARI